MLDGSIELPQAAVVVVFVGVVMRVYFGSVVFAPKYTRFWNILRRALVPVLQKVIYRHLPFDVSIENYAVEEEYVGHVDLSPQKVAKILDQERDVEVPLLSGFKTDWEDRKEAGTLVWYHGPRLGGLPRWLKKYQVHVTMFNDNETGETILTAHHEANPYRPDLWHDHLTKGESFSVERGVEMTKTALEDSELAYDAHPLR